MLHRKGNHKIGNVTGNPYLVIRYAANKDKSHFPEEKEINSSEIKEV